MSPKEKNKDFKILKRLSKEEIEKLFKELELGKKPSQNKNRGNKSSIAR